LKNKSLAFKIFTSISILLIFILFSCFYAIIMINKTQEYAKDTSEQWLPSIEAFSRINLNVGNLSRRSILTIASAIAKDTEKLEKAIAELNSFKANLEKELKDYKDTGKIAPGEEELYESTLKSYNEYIKSYDIEMDLVTNGKGLESLSHYTNEGRYLIFNLIEKIDAQAQFNSQGAKNSASKGASLTTITNWTMTIVIISSAVVALAISSLILSITASIKKAIIELKHQGESTMNISQTLKNSSQTLSDSAAQQAASVHETTAAINEITSMVNKTSENAKESTNVAKSAASKAENSQDTMNKLVNSMETIQESNNQLQNIAQIITQIHAKTSVINDIVSKTELLSLNASIESARAGEYGKGFAVVAEEVGNLAKISGKSAHEIQELITKSQEEVNKILLVTKDRINEGKSVTTVAQESFVKISEDIINMVSVIEQISAATQEQDIGVRQITTAMSEIDRATQKNQVSVNETAQSSNELVEQGEKLSKTTSEIERLILGKK
jgi:hypothetical protein